MPNHAQLSAINQIQVEDFNEEVVKLHTRILPLYQQLHGYLRHRLLKVYKNRFAHDGVIPAHLLADNWAESLSLMIPFSRVSAVIFGIWVHPVKLTVFIRRRL